MRMRTHLMKQSEAQPLRAAHVQRGWEEPSHDSVRTSPPGSTAPAPPPSAGVELARLAIHRPPEPVEAGIRRQAQQSLGADLSGVRVWQGAGAERSNALLGSRAFTVGQDIVLGPGVANGADPVLAHELAHTVQQRGARPQVPSPAAPAPSSGAHEREADRAAWAILEGRPARVSPVGSSQLQRAE